METFSEYLGNDYTEGMSEAEIISAIETRNKKQSDSVNEESEKLKTALSKSNSEAAGYKKQLKELQAGAQTAASEKEQLVARIEELERKGLVSENAARYMQLGYDKESAVELVNAVLDKDFDKIISNHTKYLEAQRKTIQADLLKETPRPTGTPTETVKDPGTVEKLGKARAERNKKSSDILKAYTRRG